MARLLLVALCIACASAFSPPATLAPRTVVARTASVEMGARGKSQAQLFDDYLWLTQLQQASCHGALRRRIHTRRRSPPDTLPPTT